jgi:hypothetical protein
MYEYMTQVILLKVKSHVFSGNILQQILTNIILIYHEKKNMG